ncbi:GTPase [Helicobacter pylori]|uniref:GTPase n=1 Tax=Helicobacter pylori TaxID=210 RepID=UPI00046D4D67|nr:GTPase [Helicobacter pylori]
MKDIYLGVEKSIKDLQSIFKNADDKDEKLKRFNQEALKVFQQLEFKSLKELESLKNNEEWENFTIAFYGETGAGKSTLIECLRMFFKEQSKVDQQERFKRLDSTYQNNYQNDERKKQAILNKLHSLQDGAIIGDGRSDFTLKTRSYSFQYHHQNFTLLDVPGIEGNEKKVIDQISNATQKAHAIFYVTKTPNPPQKGEERKRGTIEKIQRQLGSQTEVWTIFNKPINSPRALKDKLINESEKESLKILNKEMKNILGKHYMGHQIVSAQMAFYGLSSALLPESDFYKNKQKFLKDFKAEELLYQSHFKPLAEFITEALLENSRKKIIESNCNKALKAIEKLQEAIKTTIYRQIDPTIREIKNHHREVCDNLDRSKEKYISNLTNSVFTEIERFKSDFREEMHARIDDDIENKECEEIFENEHKQRAEKLRKNTGRHFNECKERFIEEMKKDIEQFEERIKDSLIMLDRINIDSGFDFSFNIDSGINKIGLFASIGGLTLLLAAPVLGEFALAAGLVLGAIGIVKSVWSFFDSDYKKSQQRKEMNKNLDKACEKIAQDVESCIESYKKGTSEMIENLKASLNDLVVCYERMREGLIKAGEDLWHLDNRIKTTLKQRIAQ